MATWQSQEIQVICKAEIQTKESDKSFFTLRQKSDQIRNPSVQQVNAANICLCYQKCISMWLPQRIWDKKQQIIWEIARNFESEFSQFEAAFVEVQSIFLQFCRRFNFTIWHMLSEKHICSFFAIMVCKCRKFQDCSKTCRDWLAAVWKESGGVHLSRQGCVVEGSKQ